MAPREEQQLPHPSSKSQQPEKEKRMKKKKETNHRHVCSVNSAVKNVMNPICIQVNKEQERKVRGNKDNGPQE